MSNLDKQADAIISTGVVGAMAAAVMPVPVADVVAITSVQLTMMTGLAANYGIKADHSSLKALVAVASGAKAGEFLGSLTKTIPGLGTAAGTAIQLSVAGTVTAAMGLALKQLLKEGKDLTAANFTAAMGSNKANARSIAAAHKTEAHAKAKREATAR